MISYNSVPVASIKFLPLILSLSRSVLGAEGDTGDIQNDVMDVTLFRGAANNTWFEVYFNAIPVEGAEKVEMESLEINLRPAVSYTHLTLPTKRIV